jgi:hypothetical protein
LRGWGVEGAGDDVADAVGVDAVLKRFVEQDGQRGRCGAGGAPLVADDLERDGGAHGVAAQGVADRGDGERFGAGAAAQPAGDVRPQLAGCALVAEG